MEKAASGRPFPFTGACSMILRRLSQNLKAQNWTAIAIEFVLLVCGVYLGIQVANWNEARRERMAERQSLLLLLKEIEQNTAYAQFVIDNAQRIQPDLAAALAMLEGAPPGEGDPNEGIAQLAVFRDSTPITATYDDLVNTGRLSILRSDKLRTKISVYSSLIEYQDRLRAGYIDRAPDILGMASPYAAFHHDPEATLGYRLSVDWPSAGRDKALVNAANRLMGDQAVFHRRRFVFKQYAQELCDALAAELDTQCVPRMD
jgi:hypothetical protein